MACRGSLLRSLRPPLTPSSPLFSRLTEGRDGLPCQIGKAGIAPSRISHTHDSIPLSAMSASNAVR